MKRSDSGRAEKQGSCWQRRCESEKDSKLANNFKEIAVQKVCDLQKSKKSYENGYKIVVIAKTNLKYVRCKNKSDVVTNQQGDLESN